MTTTLMKNDIGLCGLDFIEFCSPHPHRLEELFLAFGFSKIKHHKEMQIDYFKQNDIHFFLNQEKGSHADVFAETHGPCISSMGWRFKDREKAYKMSQSYGAHRDLHDFHTRRSSDLPRPARRQSGRSASRRRDWSIRARAWRTCSGGPSPAARAS